MAFSCRSVSSDNASIVSGGLIMVPTSAERSVTRSSVSVQNKWYLSSNVLLERANKIHWSAELPTIVFQFHSINSNDRVKRRGCIFLCCSVLSRHRIHHVFSCPAKASRMVRVTQPVVCKFTNLSVYVGSYKLPAHSYPAGRDRRLPAVAVLLSFPVLAARPSGGRWNQRGDTPECVQPANLPPETPPR